MSKDNFFNSNFLSKLTLKQKEQEVLSLDKNISTLKSKIALEAETLQQNTLILHKLKHRNEKLKKDYLNILQGFKTMKKTFWIKNNNFKLSVFDSVFLLKDSTCFILKTKHDEVIYVFDASLNNFFNYIILVEHRFIALSVDSNRILIELKVI